MSYQGDTTNLAEEVVWEEVTSGQANARVKTYSHDPFGESVSMSEQWAGQAVNHFSYLHDPGSSVSLLLDNAGYVKESYAYTGYGQAISALSSAEESAIAGDLVNRYAALSTRRRQEEMQGASEYAGNRHETRRPR